MGRRKNTFDFNILVNAVGKGLKFPLVHIPAMKFAQTMFHPRNLGDTFRRRYNDFIRFFSLLRNRRSSSRGKIPWPWQNLQGLFL